ncbi:MAG: response regulator transcription factor [Flavobacteriales bacterium]|nr:response regulator transcription factor [Flavobacteriales bacterium]
MSTEPLRCLVVDDEPLAVEVIGEHVRRTPGLVLVAGCTDPIAAFRKLEDGGIDLVFTDIRMPELTGLQLIKLAQGRTSFIVTSAYSEHAIDGFELDVVDYLLKPVRYERFVAAVEKLRARRTAPSAAPSADHFFLKSGHEVLRIDHDEVTHISAMRDYVAVHTRSKGRILSLEHLRDLEQRLPAERYCRIHRSHIVALKAIQRVERDHVVLADAHLPISDSYAKRFRAVLGR